VWGAAVVVFFRSFAHHHNYFYAYARFKQVFQSVQLSLSPHQQTTTGEHGIEKGTNALVDPLGAWCLPQSGVFPQIFLVCAKRARNLSISSFSGSVHGAKSDYVSAFLADIDIMLSNPPPKLDGFYIFFLQVVIALRTFHSFKYHSQSPL
jgi:hypothetical protein